MPTTNLSKSRSSCNVPRAKENIKTPAKSTMDFNRSACSIFCLRDGQMPSSRPTKTALRHNVITLHFFRNRT